MGERSFLRISALKILLAILLLSSIMFAGALTVQSNSSTGLNSYLRLDNSSENIKDYSDFESNAEVKGHSILFNGSAMDINATPELKSALSTNNVTIAFWIKHQAGSGWYNVMAWTVENATGDRKGVQIEMVNDNDSIYTRWIADTNACGYRGGGFWSRNQDMNSPPGEWNLYTVTYNGETIREYSNAEIQSQSSPGCDLADMVSNLTIQSGVQEKIDDFRIYNRTLKQEEIEKLYTGRKISREELVLYQKFDEGPRGCDLTYSRPCIIGDSKNKIKGFPKSFEENTAVKQGWQEDVPLVSTRKGILGTESIQLDSENSIDLDNFTLENHSVSIWIKATEPGSYIIFSNSSTRKNSFNETRDWSGDMEDLGSQDGFSDVRLANASSNSGFEDIFTNKVMQSEYPSFAGPENYVYLKFWAKTNNLPVWESSSLTTYNWIRRPEPDPDRYQLYILRSDGVESDRKEYYRIYYSSSDDTSWGYYADPELYKRNPLVLMQGTDFKIHAGNVSKLETGLPENELQDWNNFVFRRKNGLLELYLNGELRDSTNTSKLHISEISGSHIIPETAGGGLKFDEIQVYNRKISKEKIHGLSFQ